MRKQSGFTLIELVIVVVILGFLAVTAIPKFIDLTDQAKQANIEGMAGGFATGISLARAQWEAEGRSNDGTRNNVTYDDVNLVLTTEDTVKGIRPGYVTGLTDGATLGGGFDAANCKEIWDNILQQPPTLETFANLESTTNYVVAEAGDDANSHCIFYLKDTLSKTNGNVVDPGGLDVGNNFIYYPATSRVEIRIATVN